ncbi:hypothetical protein GWI33_023333 [Rhynchophorus ferrugineus]|uniref:Uncharacterized protein n=1 Tax=Rhynchophorus ferrugineus TaxID=354439 RepID=A0A834IZS6_RHYFE|nr:hypothetical protein GWI33_023333 [Rhynchophorus ferrugineus]
MIALRKLARAHFAERSCRVGRTRVMSSYVVSSGRCDVATPTGRKSGPNGSTGGKTGRHRRSAAPTQGRFTVSLHHNPAQRTSSSTSFVYCRGRFPLVACKWWLINW